MELKFDNLRGLFRPRHKLPLFHGVLAGQNEQRVSPHDARAFHTPVRRYHDFDFDLAGNVHAFGELRIRGCRLRLDLALGFVPCTRLSKSRGARKNKRSRCRHGPRPPSTSSHRHNSSWDWKMPRLEEGTWDAMVESRRI